MKLNDAIVAAAGYVQGGRKKKEEFIAAVSLFFESYYGGKNNEHRRIAILSCPITGIIKDPDMFALGIVEGVKSFPNDKNKLVIRIESLLEFLKKKYRFSVSKSLLVNFKYQNNTERLLKILKYLHSGEKSRAEIAENFGISDRALASDLHTLQSGYEFMESFMQINQLERKRNTYRSLIHPIFLALNTEEIYTMTVGLKLLSQGTVFEDSMGRVADKIYKQLSDYAQGIVDSHADGRTISFAEEDLHFINTYELMRRYEKPFAYFLKEPISCKVSFEENGIEDEIVGIVRLSENGYDRIVIELDDGETKEIKMDKISASAIKSAVAAIARNIVE